MSGVDLASARLGGRVLAANDEFFAPKENLLKPEPAVFLPDEYTDRGKWMDGWETRRRREPGHDWCVIQLGLPGRIRRCVVDTTHFKGNAPEACAIDVCGVPDELLESTDFDALPWIELLPKSETRGDSENIFHVASDGRTTHLRLRIFPDGGVSRLRAFGDVLPDWSAVGDGAIDLVAVQNGGVALACSDEFFGVPQKLIMPGDAVNMGDGWETRRRRGPGHDWVILKLGRRGSIEEIEVDTSHFKGNYPASCSLQLADLAEAGGGGPSGGDALPAEDAWSELLRDSALGPDQVHRFDPTAAAPATHVRFNIFPDGGVARLRLLGRLAR